MHYHDTVKEMIKIFSRYETIKKTIDNYNDATIKKIRYVQPVLGFLIDQDDMEFTKRASIAKNSSISNSVDYMEYIFESKKGGY